VLMALSMKGLSGSACDGRQLVSCEAGVMVCAIDAQQRSPRWNHEGSNLVNTAVHEIVRADEIGQWVVYVL